jgi:hypothetical protein
MDDIDGEAFGLQIVPEQQRQGLLVLDDQNLGSGIHGRRIQHRLSPRI